MRPKTEKRGGCSTDGVDPKEVKALYRRIIRPLREQARACGYAIAVHGSLARDIDLVAIPWTDAACKPAQLASLLRSRLKDLYDIELEVEPWPAGSPPPAGAGQTKPHGRLCWSWWITKFTYVDLSVMPPVRDASPT